MVRALDKADAMLMLSSVL